MASWAWYWICTMVYHYWPGSNSILNFWCRWMPRDSSKRFLYLYKLCRSWCWLVIGLFDWQWAWLYWLVHMWYLGCVWHRYQGSLDQIWVFFGYTMYHWDQWASWFHRTNLSPWVGFHDWPLGCIVIIVESEIKLIQEVCSKYITVSKVFIKYSGHLVINFHIVNSGKIDWERATDYLMWSSRGLKVERWNIGDALMLLWQKRPVNQSLGGTKSIKILRIFVENLVPMVLHEVT